MSRGRGGMCGQAPLLRMVRRRRPASRLAQHTRARPRCVRTRMCAHLRLRHTPAPPASGSHAPTPSPHMSEGPNGCSRNAVLINQDKPPQPIVEAGVHLVLAPSSGARHIVVRGSGASMTHAQPRQREQGPTMSHDRSQRLHCWRAPRPARSLARQDFSTKAPQGQRGLRRLPGPAPHIIRPRTRVYPPVRNIAIVRLAKICRRERGKARRRMAMRSAGTWR